MNLFGRMLWENKMKQKNINKTAIKIVSALDEVP